MNLMPPHRCPPWESESRPGVHSKIFSLATEEFAQANSFPATATRKPAPTSPPLSPPTEAAVSQLQDCVPVGPVALAIGGFVRALLSGLEESRALISCVFQEPFPASEENTDVEGHDSANKSGSLWVELRSPIIGTLATRSRVPAEWALCRSLRLSVSITKEGSRVDLEGVQVVPIEGGSEAWQALVPLFASSLGSGTWGLEDCRGIAWEWWKQEGRQSFEGTKLRRVVDSLADLGFGKVVPADASASLLLGCTLASRQNLTSLHYRYRTTGKKMKSKAVGPTTDNTVALMQKRAVDVVATIDHIPETFDATSAWYEPDVSEKDRLGYALWAETAASPVRRQTAEKFATSSLNYAALCCAREEDRGATASSVQRLFAVGRSFGGATKLDQLRGKAAPWQCKDETYQMSGNDGRVIWRPIPGLGTQVPFSHKNKIMEQH